MHPEAEAEAEHAAALSVILYVKDLLAPVVNQRLGARGKRPRRRGGHAARSAERRELRRGGRSAAGARGPCSDEWCGVVCTAGGAGWVGGPSGAEDSAEDRGRDLNTPWDTGVGLLPPTPRPTWQITVAESSWECECCVHSV